MRRISKRDAEYATICYADIFDYPLTGVELARWFLFYPRAVLKKKHYFFLPKRQNIVAIRHHRARWSQKKWSIVKTVVRTLKFVPTIELIGVTGGLALDNADRQDDIDLFFITSPDTLWITRLCVTMLMDVIGVRRHPGQVHVVNKICMNMFITSDVLQLPKPEQDVFSAHEVLQMVPLVEKKGVYGKFLHKNSWVKKYLPNAWILKKNELRMKNDDKKEKHNLFFIVIHDVLYSILRCLEPMVKVIQLWYMKQHRTTEVISQSMIRFHPRDARGWIKEKFAIRLRKRKIPLDIVFYDR